MSNKRTTANDSFQKGCRFSFAIVLLETLYHADKRTFSPPPQIENPNFFPIGEGFGFFVFFGKQNESLASIEKRPRPYHIAIFNNTAESTLTFEKK